MVRVRVRVMYAWFVLAIHGLYMQSMYCAGSTDCPNLRFAHNMYTQHVYTIWFIVFVRVNTRLVSDFFKYVSGKTPVSPVDFLTLHH